MAVCAHASSGNVGGKNASLGELYNHLSSEGIKVPDGFATTACASTPHNIAFLASFLPAKTSPMQAPKAICVRESIGLISQYFFSFGGISR